MSLLDAIKPIKHQRVIDLAKSAGLDVSDWSNYTNGETNPGANPKYCYEWAFVEPGKLIVLNLWHDNLREVNGEIQQSLNFSDALWHESNTVRKSRRDRMRDAVAYAYHEKLPVRVIVMDGVHQKDPTPDKPNRPKARLLDGTSWAVVNYDGNTGETLLKRGVLPSTYVDQFSLQTAPEGATGKYEVHGTAYKRSPTVRQFVLARARGKCEYCHQAGFTTLDGCIYLEPHHVISLANGGADNPANVVALCPNHHREAHHGKDAAQISSVLKQWLTT